MRRAARGVVGGRGVGVDRDEQAGAQPPRDLEALGEDEIAVVLAGQGDAHPARRGQIVADRAGEGERHVLFAAAVGGRDRAGIDAAMAGIDHHQRAARVARAVDRGDWRPRAPRRGASSRMVRSPRAAGAVPRPPRASGKGARLSNADSNRASSGMAAFAVGKPAA